MPNCTACGILVPRLGVKPMPLAVERQSLNQWTAREVPAGHVVFVCSTQLYLQGKSHHVRVQISGCGCVPPKKVMDQSRQWVRFGSWPYLPNLVMVCSLHPIELPVTCSRLRVTLRIHTGVTTVLTAVTIMLCFSWTWCEWNCIHVHIPLCLIVFIQHHV